MYVCVCVFTDSGVVVVVEQSLSRPPPSLISILGSNFRDWRLIFLQDNRPRTVPWVSVSHTACPEKSKGDIFPYPDQASVGETDLGRPDADTLRVTSVCSPCLLLPVAFFSEVLTLLSLFALPLQAKACIWP